ncbi:tetratricopeptide repeat protein [Streptomyces sp. 846.5]|nr:tetratricopeptide repeat protein [Streptomyces sp. 846.5]TDU02523.1 tetratricopeptide repeat protein [Streptomyces sp. 846.5]
MTPARRTRSGSTKITNILSNVTVHGNVTQVGQDFGDHYTYEGPRTPFRLVEAADPRLPHLAQARAQPSLLLDARLRVVDFAGRGLYLAWLSAWRDADAGPRPAVFLVHGEGGCGKTRLAGEFARDSAAAGWAVRQVVYEPYAPPPKPLPAGRRARCGTLLVVDYAERWPMAHLLALLNHQVLTEGGPVRVLILSRSAGTWWNALSVRLHRDGLPGEAHYLPPLSSSGRSAARLYEAARDRFAQVLQLDDRTFRAQDTPDLSGDGFDLVLAVHMAALVAVDTRLRHEAPVPADPARLSAYLIAREQVAWRTLPVEEDGRARSGEVPLGRAVHIAALTGPVAHSEGTALLGRLGVTESPAAAASLLVDHRLLYPPRQSADVLEPLYPDRLAEDFVALSTPGPGGPSGFADPWAIDVAAELLGVSAPDAAPRWFGRAVTVLIETARRWPSIATGQLFPLLADRPELAISGGGAALAALAELDGLDRGVLTAVEAALPDRSDFELDLGATALTQRLVDLDGSADPDHASADRAALLHRLARRYAFSGLYPQALGPAEAAVACCRALATSAGVGEQARTARDRLAKALQTLSRILSGVGRGADALAVAREAVALYRDGTAPGRQLDRATAQLVLGNRLFGQAPTAEAIAAYEESLELHRALAATDPSAAAPGLADTLWGLARLLSDLGQDDRALELTDEQIAELRALTAERRNEFLGQLAQAVADRAVMLSDLNRTDEQLAASEEAVQLFRVLAQANGRAFLPGLANALEWWGIGLADAGNHAEALLVTQESVALWEQLAESGPWTYPYLRGTALRSLSNRLSETGRNQAAARAATEAVALLRPLAADEPEGASSALAMALSAQGLRLLTLKRYQEALDSTQEAITLYRSFPGSDDRTTARLAAELGALAGELAGLGRRAEAVAAAQEQVALVRELVRKGYGGGSGRDPREALAYGLLTLAAQISACDPDRSAAAAVPEAEALSLMRDLYRAEPDRHRLGLARAAGELGQLLSDLPGRGAEAIALSDEGHALALEDLAAHPGHRQLVMVRSTAVFAVMARQLTELDLERALEILDSLEQLPAPGDPEALDARSGPAEPWPNSASLLRDRAVVLRLLGRDEESLKCLRSALELESAERRVDAAVDRTAHPLRRIGRLLDLDASEHAHSASALATRVIAAPPGSWERQLAQRLLRRQAKQERRAQSARLPVRTTEPQQLPHNPPTATELLADIQAAAAVDPRRSPYGRRSEASALAARGDRRGVDLLLAQVLDAGLSRSDRRSAAQALVKAGDPRGPHLLADLDSSASPAEGPERPLGWPTTGLVSLPLSAGPPSAARIATALPPDQDRAYGRRARVLAALLLPVPFALLLLTGAAVAAAPGSHPGPGNWLALVVSASLLLEITWELTAGIPAFAARAFAVSPARSTVALGYCMLSIPLLWVLGYTQAHSLLGFAHGAARGFWLLLLWRWP